MARIRQPETETAPAWFIAYQEQQNAKIAALEAELKAAKSQPVVTQSGKVYAEPKTSLAEALAFLKPDADNKATLVGSRGPETAGRLRDLGHLLVKIVPNSKPDRANPYGQPVMVNMKNSITNKKVVLKDGVDPANYYKIKDLVNQMFGNGWTYSDPTELSQEQIDKILRPVLDACKTYGILEGEAV